ncbi:MAG: phosphatidate cytidylyltransferase [Bacteroidota bacterium]
MSNLTLRVLTALVAAPLVLGAVWLGGWVFGAVTVVAAVLAQLEVMQMAEARGEVQPNRWLGGALGALAAAWPLVPYATDVLVVGLLVLLVAELKRRTVRPLENVAVTSFSVFYPAGLFGFLVALREGPDDPVLGFWLAASVFLMVWAADSLAYFTGKTWSSFAKTHPLFPRVSPKKTWEGSLGGFLGAVAAIAILKTWAVPVLSWLDVAVLGFIAGALSQLGDLAESLFKRAAGVKDSAGYLPGHGGLMDRFDALLVAAPLIYLYLDHVAQVF